MGSLLVTRLQMDMLILNAVEASTSVNEDARNLIAPAPPFAGEHREILTDVVPCCQMFVLQ